MSGLGSFKLPADTADPAAIADLLKLVRQQVEAEAELEGVGAAA